MIKLLPKHRIVKMGSGIYRPWWAVEERQWLKVLGIPIGWDWQRIKYFKELKPAQNWVRLGGEE